ncbi:MAG: tetratricopeptide repeat protein [candidate division WOR-3 bacterium]
MEKKEAIYQARDLCYHQDYSAALSRVKEICATDPQDPAGLFWYAALLQMLIYDSGNTGLIESFYLTSDSVIQLCRRRLKNNPSDAEAHLYWGLTQLNRANLLSWQGKKFAAFMTLLKVTPHLNRALKFDARLTDALFGIGVIEYFKATADRYCFGLGLIGSRERAYKLLQKARRQDGMLQPMAEFMLGFMCKEEGQFEEAIKYCNRLLERYPNNRAALRLLRDIYLDMGNYERVIILARELESDITRVFPNNRYGIAENWLKMAYAWAGLGRTDSTRFFAQCILNWADQADSVPWLVSYVRAAKWLKAKAAR